MYPNAVLYHHSASSARWLADCAKCAVPLLRTLSRVYDQGASYDGLCNFLTPLAAGLRHYSCPEASSSASPKQLCQGSRGSRRSSANELRYTWLYNIGQLPLPRRPNSSDDDFSASAPVLGSSPLPDLAASSAALPLGLYPQQHRGTVPGINSNDSSSEWMSADGGGEVVKPSGGIRRLTPY